MPKYNTRFYQCITALRPLMQGNRNLGEFCADLVDLGMRFDSDEQRSALEIRTAATWKGWANGSSNFPQKVASEISARWDTIQFDGNLTDAYSPDVLEQLANSAGIARLIPSVNVLNIGREIGEHLRNVFAEAAGHDSTPRGLLTHLEQKRAVSAPYFDEKSGALVLGEDRRRIARKVHVPEEILDAEFPYVTALIGAYCEKKQSRSASTVDDIPLAYNSHFAEQRKAFYTSEWLRETTWNYVHDGKTVFDEFLDEIFAGVSDIMIEEHPSQISRLTATLKQSTQIHLQGILLDQVASLIDIYSRKGACHQLVNQQRLSWEDPT